MFLPRAVLMQANFGSWTSSLTSAGHCRGTYGLIVGEVGLEDHGLSLKVGRERNFSQFFFLKSLLSFFFPHTIFSLVLESDCCQSRHMTQREVCTHARTHTRDGLFYMYRVLEK